jgi:hypothetical protein
MRSTLLILSLAIVCGVAPARAEKHVFIIANNPDGYGVDRCLASGASCGAAVASAYCQSREFAKAISFRRVERNEVTGAALASDAVCKGCEEYVAIECTR